MVVLILDLLLFFALLIGPFLGVIAAACLGFLLRKRSRLAGSLLSLFLGGLSVAAPPFAVFLIRRYFLTGEGEALIVLLWINEGAQIPFFLIVNALLVLSLLIGNCRHSAEYTTLTLVPAKMVTLFFGVQVVTNMVGVADELWLIPILFRMILLLFSVLAILGFGYDLFTLKNKLFSRPFFTRLLGHAIGITLAALILYLM